MKKQHLYLLVIFSIVLFTVSSCGECKKEESAEESCCQSVSADSLAGLWNNAWNTKNLEALKGMISDSALAMDHEWVIQGKDSILSKWISVNLPAISNLKTTPLKTTSCCCCVSLTGLYTLDYTTKEGAVVPSKGNFTFIWTKQQDKSYKLDLMHMTEFHAKEGK